MNPRPHMPTSIIPVSDAVEEIVDDGNYGGPSLVNITTNLPISARLVTKPFVPAQRPYSWDDIAREEQKTERIEAVALTMQSHEEGKEAVALYRSVVTEESIPVEKESSSMTPKLYCETCNDYVEDAPTLEEHKRGSIHLFNKQYKPSKVYCIDEQNPGYHILKYKLHWHEEQGLGVRNQGRREPIATRLKNDRLGLGIKPRHRLAVTHIPEKEPEWKRELERNKQRRPTRGERRAQRKRKLERERAKEKRLRAYLLG